MKSVHTAEAMKYHYTIFRLGGIHPPKKFQIPYMVFSFILNSFFTVAYPVTVLGGLYGATSFKPVVENLNVSVSLMLCCMKFLNIFLKRRQMEKLLQISTNLDKNITSEKEANTLKQVVKTCHRFFYFFLVLYSGVALTGGGIGLFAQERRLIYPAWFPFDWEASSFNYFIAYLYQFVGLFIAAMQNVVSDSYAPLFIYVLNSHLETLFKRIQDIGMDSKKSSEETYGDLLQAIRDHRAILEFVEILENVVSGVIFLQFFVSALTITVIGLYIIHTDLIFSEMVFLSNYLVAVIVEIFVFSYYGSEFSEKADSMTSVLYSCNWVDQDAKFKKVLIIFMQRTQKVNVIRGGHWIPVSLTIFLSIMKMSYSAFVVFSTIRKES